MRKNYEKMHVNDIKNVSDFFAQYLIEVARDIFLTVHSEERNGYTDKVRIHNWGWNQDGDLEVLFDTSLHFEDGDCEYRHEGAIYPTMPTLYWNVF